MLINCEPSKGAAFVLRWRSQDRQKRQTEKTDRKDRQTKGGGLQCRLGTAPGAGYAVHRTG